MSDKKIIIRNCPMYFHGNCYGHTGNCDCSDCTSCVMKKIVELCEQYKKDYNTTNGVWLLANNITNLLDIQEVE